MRKLVLAASVLTVLAALVIVPGAVSAKVGGVCSNCHTMHFSQDGALQRGGGSGVQGQGTGECLDCHSQRRGLLLKLDCLGCHASNPGSSAKIDAVTSAPQVAYNEANDSNFLAAGNYQRVFPASAGGDPDVASKRGHNVHGFGAALIDQDGFLLDTPPGYDASFDPSSLGWDFGASGAVPALMCAGANGCHGNRDQIEPMQAMKGSHHGDDSVLKFGSVDEAQQGEANATMALKIARAYRFLRGVHGAEDSDWQNTKSTTDHNEYKGADNAVASTAAQAWADVDTISEFCAECHGRFHARGVTGIGNASTGSPWVRHPTDIALPNKTEYAAYTTYSLEAPIARASVTGLGTASATVTPGTTDIVMCLSCHRAHASSYPDALRWDYSSMAAGTGCYVCHTNKD